jgi:hypothetical protein
MIDSETIPTLFTSRSCGYHNTAGHRHQATVDGDDADDGRHPEDDADSRHPLTTEPFFKGDAFVRMLRYVPVRYLFAGQTVPVPVPICSTFTVSARVCQVGTVAF